VRIAVASVEDKEMASDIGAFFIRLLKITLIMAIMLFAALGVVHVMRYSSERIKDIEWDRNLRLLSEAVENYRAENQRHMPPHVTALYTRLDQAVIDSLSDICENNLRQLGQAIAAYRQDNNGSFPPYLTILYPDYIEDKSVFICPADLHHGTQGAFPRWTREYSDWRREFGYADLDGPTLIPWEDKDTFPCSYYYRFNSYPKDNDVSSIDRPPMTWQEYMLEETEEFGENTPVISCYWHLPPYSEDDAKPLLNLLFGLHRVEKHPMNWQDYVAEQQMGR